MNTALISAFSMIGILLLIPLIDAPGIGRRHQRK